MVPIHESDLAENRWKESQWSYFELWERVEARFRKRRTRVVLGVVVLFLVLSAIPIVQDRLPKWRGLSVIRALANGLNEMKSEAARRGVPLLLELVSEDSQLGYRVSEVESCINPVKRAELGSSTLLNSSYSAAYQWVSAEKASELGLRKMSLTFCFDPSRDSVGGEDAPISLAIAPVKDLTTQRLDRLSVLYLSGNSADISFD